MKQLNPILLLLLLLVPSLSFAQVNYKQGFVVTAAGDTLRGFIDYQEWAQTPKAISFRTAENSGAVQEFTARNSRYFKVTGMEAYRSYTGPVSMNRVDGDKLPSSSSDVNITVTDTLFLRILQEGVNVALYTYKDNLKQRFFIAKTGMDDVPQELVYRRFYQNGDRSKIVSQHGYVGQLVSLARDYNKLSPRLEREIKSATYTEQKLFEVVSKINSLDKEEIAQEQRNRQGIGFFAGVALSRGTVSVEREDDFADADHNPASYMPRLAIGFDAFLNKNVQRTIFRLEAGLTSANYHLQKVENKIGIKSGYDELSYKLVQHTASLTPQVIYSLYNKDNFKLYLGAGLALNFSNYTKNHYRKQYFNPHLDLVQKPYEDDNYRKLEEKWSNYMLRAGVVLNNRYEITAAYLSPGLFTTHTTQVFSSYTSSSMTAGSLYVGVNYLFRN